MSSGDRVWAAASYEKLVRLSVGFAVIAALGLALAGPYAIEVGLRSGYATVYSARSRVRAVVYRQIDRIRQFHNSRWHR